MSSIYKLSICGVRSFDPERSETIQFGFPLTLICGQNGCGKTTIIECLKYATTGDLPPNSKGGAFVHDPKLVYKSEVRAQVKLAFSNANGKSMICTRSMQLSKKRGSSKGDNSTFKTLEGQLAIMNKGERSTISTKNAELDGQIPLYLGASKAILDYVIFCHQDDSLWPLSEASVLKKRFDDIFEALKFTKVLDNLKVIRKDMTVDIKLIEQSVEHFKIDKERANKIKVKLQNMSDSINDYTVEITQLTSKIDEYESRADKLFRSNQQFQEVLVKLENLKMQQKSTKDQISRLNVSIEILPDTSDELLEQLNNFESILESKRNEILELNLQLDTAQENLTAARSDHNKEIRVEATLKAKEENYHKNLKERKRLMQESRDKVSFDFEDETTFSSKLKTSIDKDSTNLDKLQSKNRKLENLLVDEIKKINNSNITLEQQIKHIQTGIKESEAQIENNNSKLDQLQYDEGNLVVAKSELQNLTDKFNNLKRQNELQQFQNKINEGDTNVSKLEMEIEEINKKINIANKQSELHAKLSLLRENKENRQKSLKLLIDFNKFTFLKEIGKDLKGDGDEQIVRERIEILENEIKNLTTAIDVAKSEYNVKDAELKSNEKKYTDLQKLSDSYKGKIFDVIDEDQLESYESLVNDLESDYRDSLDALNTIEVTKQFNLKAIDIAEKEKLCSLCFRPFTSPEFTNFVKLLSERVEKMLIDSLSQDCEQSKKDLESAKSINSEVLQYRKCIQDIQKMKDIIKKSEPQVLSLKEAYEGNLSNFNELKSKLSKLSTLQRPMNDLQRLCNDITSFDQQIAEYEESISEGTQSEDKYSLMSISVLQDIQQQKNQEIKNIRNKINEYMEAKYSKQKELSRLENNIKDKQLAISNLEKSLLDKTNLQTSTENLKLKLDKLNNELQNIEFELIELQERTTNKNAELEELQRVNKNAETDLTNKLENLNSIYTAFSNCDESITEYLESDAGILEKTTNNVKALEASMSTLDEEILRLQSQIKIADKSVSESANVQTNIRSNLDLRNLQQESGEIEESILELDIANAEGKRDEYQEETRKIRNLIADANAKHAGKIGEVRQMEGQIKSLKQELETEYKDIDKQYHEEWIKLQTNMLVSNDLQTYSKALDNAIMKFHSIKMEYINRIVDELWKQTYKGSDVDTIAIKSDVNLQAKGNRSYNYRVVMYKLGAELDMRGRCSAGQKVLASIIIRLALAECFGINCGMIALDEPTTNLDIDNIESLAEALNSIIDVRKKQKNFQLIIITHDEKFLSHINGDKFTDHFYRVQRDDLQRSTIRSLPISLIQEE